MYHPMTQVVGVSCECYDSIHDYITAILGLDMLAVTSSMSIMYIKLSSIH